MPKGKRSRNMANNKNSIKLLSLGIDNSYIISSYFKVIRVR